MRAIFVTFLLLLCLHFAFSSPKSFDCALRNLALEYAHRLQPGKINLILAGFLFHYLELTNSSLSEIVNALNGSPEFGDYNCSLIQPPVKLTSKAVATNKADSTFYVDSINGDDTNPGSLQYPFRSILFAISATRSSPPVPRHIYLRKGWFFLAGSDQGASTIVLSPKDNFLTIEAFPGEEVWVSGAAKLPKATSWIKLNMTGNVWKTHLNKSFPNGFSALRAGKSRLIRARFPNANPELSFGSNLRPLKWIPPIRSETPRVWTNHSVNRTDMNNGPGIQFYTLGIGGGCASYDPPAGFWCSNETVRFYGFDAEPRWPSGLTVDASVLPNLPSYKSVKGAIVHGWRSGLN